MIDCSSSHMKIVSWNTRGLSDVSKRLALKRFLKKHNSDLCLIRESMCVHPSLNICGALKKLNRNLMNLMENLVEF